MTPGSTIRAEQRFTNGRRCPICGGADRDPRGKGRRCHGFLSGDGYAHCSREEHAFNIAATDGNTYGHRLGGPCKCGTTHGTDEREWDGIVAAYDYRDERGSLLYQVVRSEPKNFWQRRPNGDGTWDKKTAGMRRVLYRLPDLLAATKDKPVFIVEGEKDVDTLRARGLVATCNPMGAGKWSQVAELASTVLRGRDVVVIADADEPGRVHAEQVAATLRECVAMLRVFKLPRKDVTDWFDDGGTVEELEQIVEGVDAETFDTAVSDPFETELAKALEDVRAKLGESKAKKRRPLFKNDLALALREKVTPPPWLISGLVMRGGVTIVAGEPKGGIKTWMLIEGALAVATGTPMFGEFFAAHGRVAFFFAEDPRDPVVSRARALLEGSSRSIREGAFRFEPRGEFLDLLDDNDLAWVVASARGFGQLDLLVLDPLRDIHSGEEDKSDSMRDVMRRLRLLVELLGCTVWVSHHTAKVTKDTARRRAGQGMRGSSAIHGSTDAGLYVEPGKGDGTNVFCATVTSQVKSGRSAGVFGLELKIADDEDGAAKRAEWTFTRPEERPAKSKGDSVTGRADPRKAEERHLEDVAHGWLLELAEKGERLTRTGCRKHATRPAALPANKVIPAIDRLIEAKRAHLDGAGIVVPNEPQEAVR